MSSVIKFFTKKQDQRETQIALEKAGEAYNALKRVEDSQATSIRKLEKEISVLEEEARKLVRQQKKRDAIFKLREKKVLEDRKHKLENIRLSMFSARSHLSSQWDVVQAKQALELFVEAHQQVLPQSQISNIQKLITGLEEMNDKIEETETAMSDISYLSMQRLSNTTDEDIEDELSQLMGDEIDTTTTTTINNHHQQHPHQKINNPQKENTDVMLLNLPSPSKEQPISNVLLQQQQSKDFLEKQEEPNKNRMEDIPQSNVVPDEQKEVVIATGGGGGILDDL